MRRKSPSTVQRNIETVVGLEQQLLESRSRADRIADAIATFSGRLTFVAAHLIWFTGWILINTGVFTRIRPFDPYPFTLLGLAVSCEAVLLSTFVLMKQSQEGRRSDARDHLNLQIDLLAEKEITKLLHMQVAICKHLGIEDIASHPEVTELSQDTAVDALAEELQGKIPDANRS